MQNALLFIISLSLSMNVFAEDLEFKDAALSGAEINILDDAQARQTSIDSQKRLILDEQQIGQQQLERFLESTRSLSAQFNQTLQDQYGYELQKSAGSLRLLRPGRFIWDYVLPYPQKIVSNGYKIWMYDSELEQVNVRAYDQLLSSSPINLLDKNQQLEVDFNVQSLPLKDLQYWVRLTPKEKDADFKFMQVGMQNGLIKTMRFTDNFNQLTEIQFSELELNPEFEEKQFEFVVPLGSDVVGDF